MRRRERRWCGTAASGVLLKFDLGGGGLALLFGSGSLFGRRRRFYLADHEFPSDISEALDEIYFKKTGRRRKGGKGKGSSSSFDDMMKGSKDSKGKGFGKGFQRFGGIGKGKSGG